MDLFHCFDRFLQKGVHRLFRGCIFWGAKGEGGRLGHERDRPWLTSCEASMAGDLFQTLLLKLLKIGR